MSERLDEHSLTEEGHVACPHVQTVLEAARRVALYYKAFPLTRSQKVTALIEALERLNKGA